MVSACKAKGGAILVHPSLGSKFVQLLSCRMGERLGAGGMIELQFRFIETCDRATLSEHDHLHRPGGPECRSQRQHRSRD